ncbi:MAG: hypothetical protein JSS83_19585 [Cyanobacteria bacterium SZAS LIN-3]|nr:hypothetical protein [Cyanobacteria bacterium SZAS LIN-3]
MQSPQTDIGLSLDPYWPKWDGPWWHALLLYELGLASRIPRSFLQTYAELVDKHYLHFFPFRLDEIPAHLDPVANVACHCFLGTYVQVASAAAIDVHEISPWIREWFFRYQTDDGGLNCDESVYSKARSTGSVTSTIAVLEAVLLESPGASDFIDRAMRYLLDRRLFRRLSTGETIDQAWLRPAFPCFYQYDVMRGLALVATYSLTMNRPIEMVQISEALEIVDACLQESGFIQGGSHCLGARTRVPQGPGLALLTNQLAKRPPLPRGLIILPPGDKH